MTRPITAARSTEGSGRARTTKPAMATAPSTDGTRPRRPTQRAENSTTPSTMATFAPLTASRCASPEVRKSSSSSVGSREVSPTTRPGTNPRSPAGVPTPRRAGPSAAWRPPVESRAAHPGLQAVPGRQRPRLRNRHHAAATGVLWSRSAPQARAVANPRRRRPRSRALGCASTHSARALSPARCAHARGLWASAARCWLSRSCGSPVTTSSTRATARSTASALSGPPWIAATRMPAANAAAATAQSSDAATR